MENHNLKEYAHLFKCLSHGTRQWRIGIYVRLSKDDGNSVSLSIINQIKSVARYLRTFEDFEIIDIYIDDGRTGTDFERNDYIRLQGDVHGKIINCLLVKDLTRYARNLADGIKELDSLVLKYSLRFITATVTDIDTYKDPTQISSPEVYQALQNAEDYARVTSKKVRDIKEIKREDGEKNGGFPPYGYLPNPNGEHWLYDPVAGELVQNMFSWSLEGMSDREIARKLNSLGIPNPTAYKESIGLKYYNPNSKKNSGLWWPTTVKRILNDKIYIGCSVQGKSSSFDHKRHKQIPKKKEDYTVVPNCHEKTVSEETFEKVTKIKSERTRVTKYTGKVHMFAGLVYCSHCDGKMRKTKTRDYEYLICRTYVLFGKEYCNKRTTISFKVLENVVLKTIQTQINLVIDLQSIVEKINQMPIIKNQSERINRMIEKSQQDIQKTELIFDACYLDWKNNDISKEQYQRIRMETETKLVNLRDTIRNLLSERQKVETGIKSNNEYFERFSKYKNIDTLDRLMVLELIDKIYITKDKTVKVEFNFQDQYLLILDFIEQNKENFEIQKTLKKEK